MPLSQAELVLPGMSQELLYRNYAKIMNLVESQCYKAEASTPALPIQTQGAIKPCRKRRKLQPQNSAEYYRRKQRSHEPAERETPLHLEIARAENKPARPSPLYLKKSNQWETSQKES
jgi:hypothetical protein